MSLIGLSPTLTATRTMTAPLNIAFGTNITLPTAANMTVRNATKTAPMSVADTVGNNYAASRLVAASSFNIAKIQTATSVSGGSVVLHVIGWNVDTEGYWRPQLLTTCSVTAGTTATNVNGTMYLGVTYAKTHGDCVVYNGNTSAVHGGFILVDVCGCELVELAMTASVTTTANAMIGFI